MVLSSSSFLSLYFSFCSDSICLINSLTKSPVFIYGSNSIVIAFLLYIQWRYATDHYRLVDKNLDPIIIRRLSGRPTSILLSIPVKGPRH
jgi:hypothetical protein